MGDSKKRKWGEYAGRFVYGGVVTALTGLIARKFGPIVGGLFLGFPSILPASLTIIREHEGRKKADDDARGSVAGSCGLVCFAGLFWCFGARWSLAGLFATASATWFVVGAALWWVGLRRLERRARQ